MRKSKATSQQRVSDIQKNGTVASAAAHGSLCPLEDAHAIPMWNYYRAHRDQLITDLRLYREHILAALRRGEAIEEVFRPYFKEAFVCQAEAGKTTGRTSASRPVWPWQAFTVRASGEASASRVRPGRAAVAGSHSAAAMGARGTGHASSRGRPTQLPSAAHLAVVGRAKP